MPEQASIPIGHADRGAQSAGHEGVPNMDHRLQSHPHGIASAANDRSNGGAVVSLFQVRALTANDHDMIAFWLRRRGLEHQPALIPPDAFVIEMDGSPVSAAWVYVSYGVGVAFWEGYVSRPDLGFRDAREAYRVACGAISRSAVARDCRFLKAYGSGKLIRFALDNGFVVDLPLSPRQATQLTGAVPLVQLL